MPSDPNTSTRSIGAGWLTQAYSLMAIASIHPNHETLRQVRRTAGMLLEGSVPEPMREALAHLAVYEPDDAGLETLEVEFTRLFVNAYPKTPLPPYESVQRGEGGLWGASTLDVVRSYADAGLKFNRTNGVAPDHLSAEMEFAAFLLASTESASESGERERSITQYEYHFITHLEPWVGQFCHEAERQARVDFYRAFGRVGVGLMTLETDRVTRERRAVCHG